MCEVCMYELGFVAQHVANIKGPNFDRFVFVMYVIVGGLLIYSMV